MTDLNTMTAAELATYFNQLQNTSLKASSYTKAKWIEKITKLENDTLAQDPEIDTGTTEDDAELEEAETFTLAELARSLGVSPKIARARYRAVENDKVRTYYEFQNTPKEIKRVTEIISPKRKKKD